MGNPDNQREASGCTRLNARNGILEDNGTFGGDAELPGSFEKHVRGRLTRKGALNNGNSVYASIEQPFDGRRMEYRPAVLARGDYGGLHS